MEGRILLVEDDRELGAQIRSHLEKAGYAVTWWTEGRRVPESEGPFGLVILDLMLPGLYGLDILKDLRERSEVPVLVLSARNATPDKVRALALGADDYMTKPFWPEELVERVKARLRRPVLQRAGPVAVGSLLVDLEARTVRAHGEPVELTRVEFEILAALVRRPGAAISRQWLVEHVLDPDREGTERTLDVHVSRLRKKLGEGNPVETVWGIGYRVKGGAP